MPLLEALRAVVHLDAGPGDEDRIDPDSAEALLVSPLAGLDATELRSFARELREREKAWPRRLAAASTDLLQGRVARPGSLAGVSAAASRKVRALAELLASARARLDAAGTVEEVLWELWSGTDWPQRLRAARGGGRPACPARPPRPGRDLCAVRHRGPGRGAARAHRGRPTSSATLVAQQIPADTLADRGVRGSAVRLLTAHRSKGLEWPLVVVAHAQEEGWPDLRRRTTLLQADRIGAGGAAATGQRPRPARRGATAVLRRRDPRA